MNLLDKLTILSDAAKYDAACTSSGAKRGYQEGKIGCTSTSVAGCCHTFSSDGRCVTLLKVLLSNDCCYNCKYCVNRCTNDTPRATFTPEELAELTIEFYRRNYIEGLFLSSGVLRSPDYTTELMIRALSILRSEYRFNGYIHAKAIPGTSPELVEQLGFLSDRLSVNIELPSEAGLKLLAPNKTKQAILRPMTQIRDRAKQSKQELVKYKHAPRFAPRAEHTAHRRRDKGKRPAHSESHAGALRFLSVKARVLLSLCAGSREHAFARARHQAAAAARAPALSGRLAAAVLRLSRKRAARRQRAGL